MAVKPLKPPKPADRPASPRHKARKKENATNSPKQAINALTKLMRKKVTSDQTKAYFEEVGAVGDDRGMAILMATGVEDALQTAIAANLKVDADDAKLFGYDSPMGTFRIASAIGIIGPATKNDLNLVKAIRNTFAHSKIPMNFETPEIAAAANLLSMTPVNNGSSTALPFAEAILKYQKRPRFSVACQGLGFSLNAYAQWCRNLTPTDPPQELSVVRVTPRSLP
jgi:hypothetical protein